VAELKGFWSYVHADNDAEGGRVARLAQDVAAQFEMLSKGPDCVRRDITPVPTMPAPAGASPQAIRYHDKSPFEGCAGTGVPVC